MPRGEEEVEPHAEAHRLAVRVVDAQIRLCGMAGVMRGEVEAALSVRKRHPLHHAAYRRQVQARIETEDAVPGGDPESSGGGKFLVKRRRQGILPHKMSWRTDFVELHVRPRPHLDSRALLPRHVKEVVLRVHRTVVRINLERQHRRVRFAVHHLPAPLVAGTVQFHPNGRGIVRGGHVVGHAGLFVGQPPGRHLGSVIRGNARKDGPSRTRAKNCFYCYHDFRLFRFAFLVYLVYL